MAHCDALITAPLMDEQSWVRQLTQDKSVPAIFLSSAVCNPLMPVLPVLWSIHERSVPLLELRCRVFGRARRGGTDAQASASGVR